MTPDVAQMDLKPFDVIDFAKYQDGGAQKDYAPPVDGRYTGRLPIILDDGTEVASSTNHITRTQEGYLSIAFGASPIVIVDGAKPGYEIKFARFSSKKYKGREGSQVMDLLRAAGVAARPKNEAELRQALKLLSGKAFQFQLRWEAFNKDNKDETVRGMENFPADPQDPTGAKRLPFIKDKYDDTKRWWANGTIHYTVSAVKGQ